jgi:hypothetical protein
MMHNEQFRNIDLLASFHFSRRQCTQEKSARYDKCRVRGNRNPGFEVRQFYHHSSQDTQESQNPRQFDH